MKFKSLFIILALIGHSLTAQTDLEDATWEFGELMQEAIYAEDYDFLDKLLDKEAFTERIIVRSDNPKLKEFNEGFLSGFSSRLTLSTILFKPIISRGSDYTLVRAYVKDEVGHLLFRTFGDDGLNYHDYELAKKGDNFKVLDLYVYLSGETLSASLNRVYLMSANGVVGQISNEQEKSLSMQSISAIPEIRNRIKAGDYAKANALLESLGPELLEEKLFALMDIQIKVNLDEEAYKSALANYSKRFPNDPSLFLVSIDLLLLNEQYDESMEMINKLDEAVGGDPFLDYYRGNIKYTQGMMAEAEVFYLAVSTEFPDFIDAFDSLLVTYIDQGKNKDAADILRYYVNTLGIDKAALVEVLESDEYYTKFRETKEFKDWKEH